MSSCFAATSSLGTTALPGPERQNFDAGTGASVGGGGREVRPMCAPQRRHVRPNPPAAGEIMAKSRRIASTWTVSAGGYDNALMDAGVGRNEREVRKSIFYSMMY